MNAPGSYEQVYKKYMARHLQNKTLPRTIKLLIDQHKADLKEGTAFPYYFDPTIPEKICRFISKLQIVNDRKQAFELQDFQTFLVFLLFGWRKSEDGTRRYTEILFSVARKNGKSELFAAIIIAASFAEGVQNNSVYAIANSEEQIKKSVYAAMGEVLKNTFPDLVKKKEIVCNGREIKFASTIITPLASNTANLDGLKVSYAVIDELHESHDPNKLTVIRSGMAARSSPLLVITTTAGFDKKSDYYQYYLMATNSLHGKPREMEKLFFIYELDKDDDLYDQAAWIKANPGLYTIKKPATMFDYARRAPYSPTDKNELMVKHLNRFIASGAKKYLDIDVLRAAQVDPPETMAGPATMGLDLSINDDLTCYAIELAGPRPYLLARAFVAEKYLDEKIRENPTYGHWLDQGLLIRAGESIDEDILFDHIERDVEQFGVRALGYDRYKAGALIARIEARWPDMMTKAINQKTGMSEPLKGFAAAVGNRKVGIERNPILEWMTDNAILFDNSGLYRIAKLSGNPMHKIDGIVAAVMAHYMGQLMALAPVKKKSTINFDLL